MIREKMISRTEQTMLLTYHVSKVAQLPKHNYPTYKSRALNTYHDLELNMQRLIERQEKHRGLWLPR